MISKEKNKEKILEIKDLSIFICNKRIFKDVSFSLNKGDFLGIIGQNGCGKSTLIKYIVGLLQPSVISKGNIWKSDSLKDKGNIRYLAQSTDEDYKMFPATVYEVISTGLIFSKLNKEEKKEEINKVLKDLDILHLKNKMIGETSGGEKQKVLIARTLVGNPKLIVLDEPTSAIDEISVQKIYDALGKINKEGTTIIMISHDLDEVTENANKVLLLDEELKYYDTTEEYIKCKECGGGL